MRVAFSLFSLLVVTSAFAQAERDPKTLADAERQNDTIVARRAFDAAARALLTPAYRRAVENYTPGAGDLLADWGAFVAADGLPFLALQLAPHDAATLRNGERITFFGIVADDNGRTIATYNVPVQVVASNTDLFVERSLPMPPRKSHGTFGLARRDTVIAVTRIDFDAEPPTAAGSGISGLIVSSDVHILPAAQAPLDPFAFGGTKVVPKPGAIFRKSEELWLFTELRNPALGTDGAPHMSTKVEIESTSKKIPGTFVPAESTPLKGVPGHYGIGNTIDITSLPPDDYKVRLTVTDMIAKQTWVREASIHLRP